MAESDYAAPVPKILGDIASVTQAVEIFNSFSSGDSYQDAFRGHGNIEWNVVPSLFRDDSEIINWESDVIRDLISLYPNEFDGDKTMFDRLVRMQHFGLRTRLLDVTRNPLAALYFTVEDRDYDNTDGAVVVLGVPLDRKKYFDSDSVSCSANLANLSIDEKEIIENTKTTSIAELHRLHPVDRLYQFIRSEKPEFMPRVRRVDLFKPYFVVPKMNNKRIVAQNGAFLIFGLKRTKGPSYEMGITAGMWRIPANAKTSIRHTLGKLGYDDSTLFPDIERSARQLMKKYKVTV